MSEPKLCPFLVMAYWLGQLTKIEGLDLDSFCREDKCAMWRKNWHVTKYSKPPTVLPIGWEPVFFCGLAGEP
jgi:hypothetical protein